jgi:serine/threonine protein kinase
LSSETHRYTPVELDTLWHSLGVVDALGQTVGLTLMPPEDRPGPSLDMHMSALSLSGCDVELIKPIAQGGMAEVFLAKQRGMEREVAVKRLKPSVDSLASRAGLLREARLTGQLEHPNVIPVHTLGAAADGGPMLVMKHIDGITWRQFIDAPDARADALTGDTPFAKHLDVLMQVAKAVHYAHSRGVVHRDIKPENVMIGRFGDVYLLDWGIAVRLDPAPQIRLDGIAGTPGYMAPEMVGTADMPISPLTDVFLMGAVLHELITGKPPNNAQTVHQALHQAYRAAPPKFGPDVSTDLASICWRAMAREPSERFADAETFRQALLTHLSNRESAVIAHEAQRRLMRLRRAVKAEAPDPAEVYRAYGAARFGFEQALRRWPDNLNASRGQQHTLECMIEFALDQGHPDTAEALTTELGTRNPRLEARIAVGFRRQAAHTQELLTLRALEHQSDPEIGARTRSRVALSLGAVLGVLAMVGGEVVRRYLPAGVEPIHYLPHGLLLFLITAGFLFANRRVLTQTQHNQRIGQMTLLMMGGGAVVFRAVVVLAGLPIAKMLPLELVLYAVAIAMMGFATHRRLALAALPALLGAGAMIVWPHWSFEIAGATVFTALAVMAAVWQREAGQTLDDRPSPRSSGVIAPAPAHRRALTADGMPALTVDGMRALSMRDTAHGATRRPRQTAERAALTRSTAPPSSDPPSTPPSQRPPASS